MLGESPLSIEEARWIERDAPPALAAGEVHVWRLSTGGDRTAAIEAALSAEERARAARFRSAAARARFVLTLYAPRPELRKLFTVARSALADLPGWAARR